MVGGADIVATLMKKSMYRTPDRDPTSVSMEWAKFQNSLSGIFDDRAMIWHGMAWHGMAWHADTMVARDKDGDHLTSTQLTSTHLNLTHQLT